MSIKRNIKTILKLLQRKKVTKADIVLLSPNQRLVRKKVIINSITFTLGQRYVSALGLECVELLVNSYQGHSQRSAACKREELWYQVPQLEQASVGNLLADQ